MKKIFICIVYVVCIQLLISQPYNYGGGNGEVLDEGTGRGYSWVLRKHVQNVEFSDSYRDNTLYSSHDANSSKKGQITLGDRISITEIYFKDSGSYEKNESWLKVRYKNIDGWLRFGNYDMYEDGEWSILNVSELQNTKWTARKFDSGFSLYTNLNVRDKPGVSGSTVLYTLKTTGQGFVETVAVTEQKETIDGITDYWLKIEYEPGKFGWIFAGYVTVERGGPKYHFPETTMDFLLGEGP